MQWSQTNRAGKTWILIYCFLNHVAKYVNQKKNFILGGTNQSALRRNVINEMEEILGDIIINVNRVEEQAKEYGHSIRREFAFLIAHSMFHLCGYDHMNEHDEKIMFTKQDEVLNSLGITRE